MPARETADGTEKAANASSGPGGRLRQAREAQGLQLEEVANELRVGAASLVALEENRFDALGAAVFARGYLKQYGSRLGLDVRELLALYEQAAGESEIGLAPTKRIHLRDERQISLWVVAAFLIVLVVGGLSYWWWRDSNAEATSVAAGGDEGAAGDLAEAPASEGVADPAPAFAAVSEPPTEPATERASEQAVAATLTDSPASPAGEVELAAVTDGPVLEVTFIEDSWAEITDEDGSRLYYNLGRAGTRARLPADRNLTFDFGNAAGVELRVDGENVPLPRAAPNGIVHFDLDDVMD